MQHSSFILWALVLVCFVHSFRFGVFFTERLFLCPLSPSLVLHLHAAFLLHSLDTGLGFFCSFFQDFRGFAFFGFWGCLLNRYSCALSQVLKHEKGLSRVEVQVSAESASSLDVTAAVEGFKAHFSGGLRAPQDADRLCQLLTAVKEGRQRGWNQPSWRLLTIRPIAR